MHLVNVLLPTPLDGLCIHIEPAASASPSNSPPLSNPQLLDGDTTGQRYDYSRSNGQGQVCGHFADIFLSNGWKHANQYANELKQWDVVVQRVKLKHTHEYCLERYFIHKYNPGRVQRWLVLDSHYVFKQEQYRQLAKIVRKWVESGKPFYAHRCPRTTLYTDRRPYNGGCFGSTLNLFQMYDNDQVPGYQEMVAERARSKKWYGVDEEFLRLMMIHYLGSERSEKDNVQTGPKPAGRRLLD